MNLVTLIAKKRDGGELTSSEIGQFIAQYADGRLPDYQMSAMAIYLRGMSVAETAALTEHMLASGAAFTWDDSAPPRVDKHSTGGIGDKVSLLLAPMLACCGAAVPMISGRGLGPTGGTLDKLEAIPGFRTNLSRAELRSVIDRVGCFISGATAGLAPADRKLYALRDVTATVPSIPLITASIMSKKLAEGLDALVLDVKYGSGAFMKSVFDARQLAQSLVDTGRRMGVTTSALLTDMNQPLGRMVGNAVEIDEAVAALEGVGPPDLIELTLALGVELLGAIAAPAGPSASDDDALQTARAQLQRTIDSGAARERLALMAAAQGGDLDAPRPRASASDVTSPTAGYVARIDAERLGEAIIDLGGGRMQMDDPLDHSTGMEMLVRLADPIDAGHPLVRVFSPSDRRCQATETISASIEIADQRPPQSPLIIEQWN